MTGIEQLWAGWRVPDMVADERDDAAGEGTLFERILRSGLPDEQTYVLHRGDRVFTLMNLYPYTSGHCMVVPVRPAADLVDLGAEEHDELWREVRAAVVAVRGGTGCQGVNVGINLGVAAGPSIPEHLHVHVVPRFRGDTNFMTATANTRVLPVTLSESWERIRRAWPAGTGSDTAPGAEGP